MDNYIEQCVSGPSSKAERILYKLCWCATVVLVILAVFLATGVVGSNPAALEIKWGNLALLLVCLAFAYICFRKKDTLRVEYDYFLGDGVLEISAVYNASRRKNMEQISLSKVVQMGVFRNPEILQGQNLECHSWYLNRDARIYYLVYTKESKRHMALLELNDEMITAIRRGGELPRNAWRDEEGKSSNYASLS